MIKYLLILAILPILLIPIYAQNTNSLFVITDKEYYYENEIILATGEVSEIVEDTKISFTIIAPNGNIVSIDQLIVGEDKKFSTSVAAGGALMKTEGTYTVKVNYDEESAETTFEFLKGTPQFQITYTQGIPVINNEDTIILDILGAQGDTIINIAGDNLDEEHIIHTTNGKAQKHYQFPREALMGNYTFSATDQTENTTSSIFEYYPILEPIEPNVSFTISTNSTEYTTNNTIQIDGIIQQTQGNSLIQIKLLKNNNLIENSQISIINNTFSHIIPSEETWDEGTYIIQAKYKNETIQTSFEFEPTITPLRLVISDILPNWKGDVVFLKIYATPPNYVTVEMFASDGTLFDSRSQSISSEFISIGWFIQGTIPYDTYSFTLTDISGIVSWVEYEYVESAVSSTAKNHILGEAQTEILQRELTQKLSKINKIDSHISRTYDLLNTPEISGTSITNYTEKIERLSALKETYQGMVDVIAQKLLIYS